jgi:hypothetical protein
MGSTMLAFSAHHEFQLSGPSDPNATEEIPGFYSVATVRVALREMPREFSEKFQKTPANYERYEKSQYFFALCI